MFGLRPFQSDRKYTGGQTPQTAKSTRPRGILGSTHTRPQHLAKKKKRERERKALPNYRPFMDKVLFYLKTRQTANTMIQKQSGMAAYRDFYWAQS